MKYIIQQMQRHKTVGELNALKATYYEGFCVAQEKEYKEIREKIRKTIEAIEEIYK
jgi:hypothetical protein